MTGKNWALVHDISVAKRGKNRFCEKSCVEQCCLNWGQNSISATVSSLVDHLNSEAFLSLMNYADRAGTITALISGSNSSFPYTLGTKFKRRTILHHNITGSCALLHHYSGSRGLLMSANKVVIYN